MKKLFSLVVLAGMLMLMSFSFKADRKVPSEDVQNSCNEMAMALAYVLNEPGDTEGQYATYGYYYDFCITNHP